MLSHSLDRIFGDFGSLRWKYTDARPAEAADNGIAFPLEGNISAKPTNRLLVAVSKYKLRSTIDTQGDFKP